MEYLSVILNSFDIYFEKNKKVFFITLSVSSLIINFVLSRFECITCSLSLSSLVEIKLVIIVNWIFQVSDFLRSFMISFKYVLILSRYSSTDSILFLIVFYFYHQYFCIQFNYYFTNYSLLLVYNNFLLLYHTHKDS